LHMSTVPEDALYGLDWVALAATNGSVDGAAINGSRNNVTVLRCPPTTDVGATVVDGTRRTLRNVLQWVQDWLSSDSHDDDARLVVLTHGAVAVDSSEDVTDLGQAAVWGLLRSAQSENPGRIWLVDLDDCAKADVAMAETACRGESQLAIRDGVWHAPRLARAEQFGYAQLNLAFAAAALRRVPGQRDRLGCLRVDDRAREQRRCAHTRCPDVKPAIRGFE